MNRDDRFDIESTLNNFYGNDTDANPYINQLNLSNYSDIDQFILSFKNSKKPFFLSLNIRSLNSKYFELKQLISEISSNNINVIAIVLQEIWQIPYPDLLAIEGYSFFTA